MVLRFLNMRMGVATLFRCDIDSITGEVGDSKKVLTYR